ncbi:Hypothetical predicted protein [Lynx pardinus]|uniref:Uncharacterized protein n=1 Tax=Lynx pardinus TaxID=191816 RepID=A0A485PF35_LYNPA|nr:Hypothetical predicted protein [Lynx pardinus]
MRRLASCKLCPSVSSSPNRDPDMELREEAWSPGPLDSEDQQMASHENPGEVALGGSWPILPPSWTPAPCTSPPVALGALGGCCCPSLLLPSWPSPLAPQRPGHAALCFSQVVGLRLVQATRWVVGPQGADQEVGLGSSPWCLQDVPAPCPHKFERPRPTSHTPAHSPPAPLCVCVCVCVCVHVCVCVCVCVYAER